MRKNGAGYLYLLTTVILFSTYEAVSKTLVGKIDPFQISFIRFFIGGAILFTLLLIKKDILINKRDLAAVTLLGITNVVISMSFLQAGLYVSGAKASVVAVIFSSNPIFVTAFASILEKEKVSLHKLAGLALGIMGIVVIFLEKLDLSNLDYRSPLMALLSAVFYGIYTVIGRKVSVRVGSLKMNSYSFIIGSLLLLPVMFALKVPVVEFDYSGLPQVIYLSVLVTGVAYVTYFKGLSIMGASSGSLVFFLKPALAGVIAIVFLKEQLTLNLFLGTALIILGITVVIYWTSIKEKLIKVSEDKIKREI